MNKITQSLLLVLVSLLISLVIFAPARLVYYFLPETSAAQLNGVSGTLWSGNASQLSWQNQPLGKLQWKINPLHFIKLRAGGHFTLTSPTMKVDGNATINRNNNIIITDSKATIDVSALPLPVQAANMVKPVGTLKADIISLDISDTLVNTADIDVVWKNAAIVDPMNVQLGEILLDINGANGDLNGLLSGAKNNPITLDGSIDLLQGTDFKTDIKITPTNSTPDDILGLLPLIGRPDAAGAVSIKYSGKL